MNSAVSVRDVSKRFRLFKERNQTLKHVILRGRRAVYEEFWALKNVSFEIPHGSTFGLIGENGSGKSTMLKCMARILTPDSGEIETRGKVSALLELGAGFHPELSGRENVFLNGTILGLSGKDLKQRFDSIVEFSGIERFIDTPVKNYSSGMYVRLGFSIAINVEPDVLLVDEVLAVGDEEFQQRCRSKFAELRASGSTIIIVSHAMELVAGLCDSCVWLEGGEVRREGLTDPVIAAYLDHVHGHDRPREPDRGVAAIESVQLICDGSPTEEMRAGSSATFRVSYRASAPLERPVFTLQFYTDSGIEIARSSSADANPQFVSLHGSGYADLRVRSLPFVDGSYRIIASISDRNSGHVFDRNESLTFRVERATSEGGLVMIDGDWELRSIDEATA